MMVALSGGVGGAKLALGLARTLEPRQLAIVANTADDFEHLGLTICPDLDTLMYTLADVANPDTGWGRADESWSFMATLAEMREPDWFRLGDRDLAVHVVRSARLRDGYSLSDVTRDLCRRLAVDVAIYPMSDDPVRTVVHTRAGDLPFQHYFVRERCVPEVTGVSVDGADRATLSRGARAALESAEAVIVCPSNPFVSIDPILALSDLPELLRSIEAPVIAVSPIVGGRALKGPTAKMLRELGKPCTAVAVARHYLERGRLDGFVLDRLDEGLLEEVRALGIRAAVADTVMRTLDDRERLAATVVSFARGAR